MSDVIGYCPHHHDGARMLYFEARDAYICEECGWAEDFPQVVYGRPDLEKIIHNKDCRIAALTAELEQVRKELHRFQTGRDIESDHICEHALDQLPLIGRIQDRDMLIANLQKLVRSAYREALDADPHYSEDWVKVWKGSEAKKRLKALETNG